MRHLVPLETRFTSISTLLALSSILLMLGSCPREADQEQTEQVRWKHYTLVENVDPLGHLSATLDDGKPVLAYVEKKSGERRPSLELRIARSNSGYPTSDSDWEILEFGSTGSQMDFHDVELTQAGTETLVGFTGPTIVPLEQLEKSGTGTEPAEVGREVKISNERRLSKSHHLELGSLGGSALLAFEETRGRISRGMLFFAELSNSHLSANDQWQVHLVDSGCFRCRTGTGVDLEVFDGTPWLSYRSRNDPHSRLMLAKSDSSSPVSTEDWTRTEVTEAPSSSMVHETELLNLDGSPMIFFIHSPPVGIQRGGASLRVALPRVSNPFLGEEWDVYTLAHDLTPHDTTLKLSADVLDGRPAVAFRDENLLRLAWGKEQKPSARSDWELFPLAKVGQDGGQPEVFELSDGTPAVAYHDGFLSDLKFMLGTSQQK